MRNIATMTKIHILTQKCLVLLSLFLGNLGKEQGQVIDLFDFVQLLDELYFHISLRLSLF